MRKLGVSAAVLSFALSLACDRIEELRRTLLGGGGSAGGESPELAEAESLCEAGQVDAAIERLESFTEKNSGSAEGYYRLGSCYLKRAGESVDSASPLTEDEQKARDGLQRALSLNPRHALAAVGLGDLYLRRVPEGRARRRRPSDPGEDWQQLAVEAYEKAVTIDPKLPEAQMHYARLLERTGQIQEAERALQAAAGSAATVPEKAPDFYMAYGRFLAGRPGRLQEAIDQFELARMFRQDDLAIQREIAVLYCRLGQEHFANEQYSLAEQALSAAYGMFPDKSDPEAQKASATLQRLSAMRGR